MTNRLAHSRVALIILALAVSGAWLAPPVGAPFEQVLGSTADHSLANPPTTQATELTPPATELTRPTVTLPPITTGTLPPSPTLPLPTPTVPLAAPEPAATTTSSTEPPAPAAQPVPEAEALIHHGVEQLRLEAGLEPLAPDPGLHHYARTWALHMADTGALQHSDLGDLIDGWQTVGENIGAGAGAQGVLEALIASPSHLAIMLEPTYSAEGIGVVQAPDGQLWVCHVFAGAEPAVTLPTITVPTLPLP